MKKYLCKIIFEDGLSEDYPYYRIKLKYKEKGKLWGKSETLQELNYNSDRVRGIRFKDVCAKEINSLAEMQLKEWVDMAVKIITNREGKDMNQNNKQEALKQAKLKLKHNLKSINKTFKVEI